MFFAPTVLADVTHDMKIANEEAFGPVMTIIKFETEQEVVSLTVLSANCFLTPCLDNMLPLRFAWPTAPSTAWAAACSPPTTGT